MNTELLQLGSIFLKDLKATPLNVTIRKDRGCLPIATGRWDPSFCNHQLSAQQPVSRGHCPTAYNFSLELHPSLLLS